MTTPRRGDGASRRNLAPRDETLVRLGAHIRELRKVAHLSQAQLGHPYIGRAAISSIEHGRSMPSLRSLAHIAAQLRVPIRELFPESDRPD